MLRLLKKLRRLKPRVKLSITLDTFPTRIMKRSVRQQPLRRIFAALQQEEAPANGRADPAVAPVTHEIPPDHEFQFLHFVMFCLSAPMIKQFLFHPCSDAFTSRIIMHLLPARFMLCTMDFRESQIRMFQRFTAQFGTHMIRHCQAHWQQIVAVKNR